MHPQSSQAGQRPENYKRSNKPQQKFVPKATVSTSGSGGGKVDSNATQNCGDVSRIDSLTSSLRRNSGKASVNCETGNDEGSQNRASRKQGWHNSENSKQVWRSGEKSLSMKQGSFVKYLPQDDAVASGLGVDDGGIDAVETQGVADLLNNELRSLLWMRPREFWREVATDASLHEFLDSYLRFRKRWYDLPHRSPSGLMAGVVVGDCELNRRVFMVLYRMSLNQDPNSRASENLSSKEHTALLQEKKLLDIPKLMDVCAIYGRDNAELTRFLVFNALKSQPGLVDDLTQVVPQFLAIVNTMHGRCCSTLEALSLSENNETIRVKQFHEDLLEVMDFINDAVATLDAFVEAHPAAAAFFISSGVSNEGNEELLPSLATMHDLLLPVLHKGFLFLANLTMGKGHMSASPNLELGMEMGLKKVRGRILKFTWQMLHLCYLSQTFGLDDCQYGSTAVTKIFPARIEDPVVRGEILVQAICDIGIGRSSSVDGPISSGQFLWNLERRHRLMNKLDELCRDGWIHLDEAQYGYISLLAGRFEYKNLKGNAVGDKVPDVQHVSLKDQITSEEETVILQSKVSQIKDIFPHYGDGFLFACLDVYDNNPEEVIKRILEGTLHPDLLSLDTSLQTKPTSKSSSLSKNDKGKGRLEESVHPGPDKAKLDAACSKKIIASSSSASDSTKSSLSPDVKASAAGRYVRRQKDDVNAAKILDQQDVKDSFRSAILAAEYEDEYDDSFDELGMSVADSGIEETESLGDRLPPQPAPSWMVESTPDDVGPSGRPYSDFSGRTWREKSVHVTPDKPVHGMTRPHLNGSAPSVQKGGQGSYGRGRLKEQQKSQFYVKDGKNYSYKVAGAVAVASAEEAEALKKTEDETIYGLGAGGNVPFKAIESTTDTAVKLNTYDTRANQGGSERGRGGYVRSGAQRDKAVYERKNHDNHHRKDRAMKKHSSGLGGY